MLTSGSSKHGAEQSTPKLQAANTTTRQVRLENHKWNGEKGTPVEYVEHCLNRLKQEEEEYACEVISNIEARKRCMDCGVALRGPGTAGAERCG